MNIAYFFQESWEQDHIKKALPDDAVAFYQGSLADSPSIADRDAAVLSVFVNSQVGEVEMQRFPALKLIATRSTGFDHVDLDAAKKRGIAVCNVPFYGENTVAEFTFALLLALSRKIEAAHRRVIETARFTQEGLRGFDLAGKTIGVVGGGHIGIRVARIAKGFEMKVLVFDLNQNQELARENGFSYVTLEDLLAQSDIVTLHVPYNEHTHHLLNRETFSHMKRGAYLINTARGAVVETRAMVEALAGGILAGAGLDVLEEEGDLSDELKLLAQPTTSMEELQTVLENHYLISHPRVVVSPHIAFNTQEAIMRILDSTIANLKAFSSGAPTNVVS